MRYVLVKSNAIVRSRQFDTAAPTLSSNKGEWLPVAETAPPIYDPEVERIEEVLTINGNIVNQSYTIVPIPLINVKRAKLAELKAELLSRMGAVMPGLSDEGTLEIVIELWRSIAPAARNPTSDMATAISILVAWRSAKQAINALATQAGVAAYNVVTDPAWP
ncbi:MAG TPA: hypothetical protein DCZ12_17200 [Gammaproteobacteria bacterium]|nr:hypothetical protein [Gammaproteobacteria bacterium]